MMKSTTALPISQNDRQSDNVFLTLDVNRGKTSHPQRPVKTPRFLIGAGSGCDLSLGGDEIPPLHTILLIQSGQVLAEAIAQSPRLTVNGKAVGNAVLKDGDVLAVGAFEFVVRINADVVAQTAEPLLDLYGANTEIDDQQLPEAEEMSAEELVDLIGSELSDVEEFEQSVQTGNDALLSAIRDRQFEQQPHAEETAEVESPTRHIIHGAHQLRGPRFRPVTVEDEQLVQEFERVRRELEEFSNELEKRFDRVNKREAHFDAAAKELIEAQNKLSTQLGTLLEQIETRHSELQPRAIA